MGWEIYNDDEIREIREQNLALRDENEELRSDLKTYRIIALLLVLMWLFSGYLFSDTDARRQIRMRSEYAPREASPDPMAPPCWPNCGRLPY